MLSDVFFWQILTSVLLNWTPVMRMLIAPTPMDPLAATVDKVTMEMETVVS